MAILSEIFYWVLNMSIVGGITGVIVAIMRKLSGVPRFTVYLLWCLPLIRLWVPFGIASRWSLLNLISHYTTKTVVLWERAPGTPELSMSNSLQAASGYFPVVYKTELLKNVFEAASVIWAIAAAAAILTVVSLYILTKREIRGARYLRDNIWTSDKITSPAVYGVFKPRVLIPDGMAETNMPFILAHERVHIRRRDNMWRMAAVITACIHWFNPLSWIFLRWFFTDMELACDTKALRNLGEDKGHEYAAALLACAAGKSRFASAFGETKIRMRIENILSYKKLTVLSAAAFGALAAAVAFVLSTNAVGG